MAIASKKNINQFQQTLLTWYSREGRHFPWRNKGLTQYQIIIAETLLQRTKAETIAKFYCHFIEKFPTWTSLTQAKTAEIERCLQPIGLYRQRAKRLKSLALEMVVRKGRLPTKRTDLESIPFIGQYIANSIELLIYKKPSPLIDVNMARLLERYFGKRAMADIRYDPNLQKLAQRIVSLDQSIEMNWAILDFAAMVCKARKPVCTDCLIARKCLYFNSLK